MNEKMEIDFEWRESNLSNEIAANFAASLRIRVGEVCLTRLEDRLAKSVRDQMRGSAWHLAAWFAGNWWRVCHEPAGDALQCDMDWRNTHDMAAAGGGFVWPSITFVSDGETMTIFSESGADSPAFEPVRYLHSENLRIPLDEFKRAVDVFMDGMIARMEAVRVRDRSLQELWQEILEERREPALHRQRKMEAIAGYDPDEAPAVLLERIEQAGEQFGAGAVEEVSAQARHAVVSVLEEIESMSAAPETGIAVSLPNGVGSGKGAGEPWQQAQNLARQARRTWDLGEGPLSDKQLANLLQTKVDALKTQGSENPVTIPLALRQRERPHDYHLHMSSRSLTTRRFAVSRLLGDHLRFPAKEETLRPITAAKTFRQKFQRAFAQELLCPIETLRDKIKGTAIPDEDTMEEIADEFGVSPLMLGTTLVNHRMLDREMLSRIP